MISKNISLNITACLSGLEFSFDELILETKNLFEEEGIPGFLKVLIAFTDQVVVENYRNSNQAKCCPGPHLNVNGSRSKSIFTSVGKVKLEWKTLRCKNCNKTHLPLKNFFDLGNYQKASNEFEKSCMETVSKESFRKSADTINLFTGNNIKFRTLHNLFKNTDSDAISVIHDDLDVIIGDGTGYKKFVSQVKQDKKNRLREKTGQAVIEETNRGEVKLLIGINDKNEVVPLGAWCSESWKVIGNLVHKANNPNKKLAPTKLANMLVADGEIGLNNGLQKLAYHRQRCLWHIPHELGPLMKYQEKASLEDIKYALNEVHSIFELDIPDKEFDKVEEKELVEMNEKILACEMKMKILAEYLESKGHSRASTYINNAKDNLFTYLKYWMKTGLVTPKVTSKIERLMREINRRIKKFAFNWSEKGCAKMTRLLLKLICDRKSWDNFWDLKMKLSGNIRLTFGGIF